jgi:hypothetical protein
MVIGVVIMKITTVKEFRDKATAMFRSSEPVLVTRRGKAAGLYFPLEGDSIPLDLRMNLQLTIADLVKKSLEQKGISEKDILEDFETFRDNRS